MRQTVEFWRGEKDRDLLNNTMGALWWSYQYLDEQVRRCFAYCSIFPRRHRLKRGELVKLWVAEGFIKTSKPEEEMEDVAKNYFDELLSASFLQLGGKEWSNEYNMSERAVDYFTIHDLLCDLAEEVAGRDCFRMEKGCTGDIPQDVRHLFLGTYNGEMLVKNMSRLQNLRTLIIDGKIEIKSPKCRVITGVFTMLMGLQKLRVLKLNIGHECSEFSIPDSIGQLKHLRYFSFMSRQTSLTLPCAFTKLYQLQVVDFGCCYISASFSGEDTMNLVNLRRIIGTPLLYIPNIGRLTWLQMLPFFRVMKTQGFESHQLKHLNKLQDKLEVAGLENVQSKEEALEVNLAAKEKLTELELVWEDQSCSPGVQAEVLEGLCPSKYLERLSIYWYGGMTLPKWMMDEHNGGPTNLQELRFNTWSQQGPAPDLGAFVHLHLLNIFRCSWDALQDMEHLTSLKNLVIMQCPNMRSFGTLPKSLELFSVFDCDPEFKRLCDDYWSITKPLGISRRLEGILLRTGD